MNERYANGYVQSSNSPYIPYQSTTATGKEQINWQDAIFNDSAMRTGHELSLSGGNDVSTFIFFWIIRSRRNCCDSNF
jgi:hypothetical protein